jgi:hypothetical protein
LAGDQMFQQPISPDYLFGHVRLSVGVRGQASRAAIH